MNFYTADLHIGHENSLRFDERPFASVEEMSRSIIENWNSVVGAEDDVYVLGDFAWKNDQGDEVLRKLNGNKFLILGNHDRPTDYMRKGFVWIKDYAEIVDNGTRVVLCHYPIAHWKNADRGAVHLYGHIHTSRDSRPFNEYRQLMRDRGIPYECYNVGCMLHGYFPKTLEQIIAAGYI